MTGIDKNTFRPLIRDSFGLKRGDIPVLGRSGLSEAEKERLREIRLKEAEVDMKARAGVVSGQGNKS